MLFVMYILFQFPNLSQDTLELTQDFIAQGGLCILDCDGPS